MAGAHCKSVKSHGRARVTKRCNDLTVVKAGAREAKKATHGVVTCGASGSTFRPNRILLSLIVVRKDHDGLHHHVANRFEAAYSQARPVTSDRQGVERTRQLASGPVLCQRMGYGGAQTRCLCAR